MLAVAAAMVKDFLVVATGFFQGVGQERQAVERAVEINAFRHGDGIT